MNPWWLKLAIHCASTARAIFLSSIRSEHAVLNLSGGFYLILLCRHLFWQLIDLSCCFYLDVNGTGLRTALLAKVSRISLLCHTTSVNYLLSGSRRAIDLLVPAASTLAWTVDACNSIQPQLGTAGPHTISQPASQNPRITPPAFDAPFTK
jgi:hypothetical protein